MCNRCGHNNCGCPQPCTNCLEPEVYTVRRSPKPNFCANLLTQVKELFNLGGHKCTVKFGTPVLSGSSVTLTAQSGSVGPFEYSLDGISWQFSPTFTGQFNGTRKYYIRERKDSACIAAGYVTVTQGVCQPNWVSTGDQPECRNGFISNYESDGCGNFRWQPTATTCSAPCDIPVASSGFIYTGTCNGTTPNPNASVGVNGISGSDGWSYSLGTNYSGSGYEQRTPGIANQTVLIENLTQGNLPRYYTIRLWASANCWLDRTVMLPAANCGTACVNPSSLTAPNVVTATCVSNVIQSDGGFSWANIINSDKFGYSLGQTYTGTGYANATIFTGGFISVTGITGSTQVRYYTIRLFNGSDSCFYDRLIEMPATICNQSCIFPQFTFFYQNPTCTGNVPSSNGSMRVIFNAASTRYQIVQDSTFSITPNYANATHVTSLGVNTNVFANIGFAVDQPYKDYTIRVYNGNQDCYSDSTLRFPNPCFEIVGCVTPSYSGVVANPATCTSGAVIQNNASMKLTGLNNTNRYGYSIGSVYSGPAYGSAVTIVGSEIFINNLNGSPNASNYVIRIFNATNDCHADVLITIPGTSCTANCVNQPSFTAKAAIEATCNGDTVNNNAGVSITGIANATKYGYALGATYAGPAFSSGINVVGSQILVNGLPGSPTATTYTFRIWNGAADCYIDVTQVIPGKTCSVTCVNPTFSLSSTPPTCNGDGSSNNDGVLSITGLSNGTKYQLCIAPSWTCTPNFENSPIISGSGPHIVLNDLGFSSNQEFRDFTVRVYNGSATCYTTQTLRVFNPCVSCCELQINSVTVINS